MTGALIILAVTVAIGVLLWAWEKFRTKRHGPSLHHHSQPPYPLKGELEHSDTAILNTDTPPSGGGGASGASASPAICCGLHAICEKTGQINEPPLYYDDEELDCFAGRPADGYTDKETEEFRDVLLTLRPADAPGWSVSLEKRRIALPVDLRPELELLLSEINDQ